MGVGQCRGAGFSIGVPRRDVWVPGFGRLHSAGLKNKGELYSRPFNGPSVNTPWGGVGPA